MDLDTDFAWVTIREGIYGGKISGLRQSLINRDRPSISEVTISRLYPLNHLDCWSRYQIPGKNRNNITNHSQVHLLAHLAVSKQCPKRWWLITRGIQANQNNLGFYNLSQTLGFLAPVWSTLYLPFAWIFWMHIFKRSLFFFDILRVNCCFAATKKIAITSRWLFFKHIGFNAYLC